MTGHSSQGSLTDEDPKVLGAFYTDAQVADFLTWWAIRSPRDTVMDPSFGGGVFLWSACKRLLKLGGQPHTQVFGVEINPDTHSRRQPRVRMGNRRIDTSAFSQGQERLIEYFIPKKARELYRELKLSRATRRLGELADVGIGYVTGANEFFHLTLDAVRAWGIPTTFLKPSIRRSRALAGLRFTQADWRAALEAGEACYLLAIEAQDNLPKSVRQYLEHGESLGVCRAYKCRTRSPWFRVPHVYQPDAFLTYMSGETPRLVANETEAVAPNSLHILRLRPPTKLASDILAALWQTSLTRLSAEIEGHALGGGMLKLEPTEAERVVVPAGDGANGKLAELVGELDELARNGENAVAQTRADQVLLRDDLGLSQSDCQLLKKAAEALCTRRHFKGAAV